MNPDIISIFTISLYGAATFCGLYGFLLGKRYWRLAGIYLGLGAFLCQTAFLVFGYHRLFPGGPSMGAYLQLVAWFILLVGIIAWRKFANDSILLLVIPLCLILFLISMPYVSVSLRLPSFVSISFYVLHIGCLFLSLAVMALAFVCALVFLALDSDMKKKKMQRTQKGLPALVLLDKINSFCALSAFPLYTVGLIAGFFWSNPLFGNFMGTDPKKLVSVLVWLLLAVLFHNRLAKNWKGRKPAIMIVTVFLLSLFSISIVNFFLPTQHNFTGI